MSYAIEKSQKLADNLGYKHFSAARKDLQNMIILMLTEQLGEHKCFRCNQPVTDINELSLDHGTNWRSCDNKEDAQRIFWDVNDLHVSHVHCNTPDFNRGTNKNGYIGVKTNVYHNTGNTLYVADIGIDGKNKQVGYSKDPKIAAFFRDIGIFKYRNGNGKLNFEQLREFYATVKNREWKSFTDEELNGILGRI